MTVMQQTASAGIMAGDRQELSFRVREGASAEILSQAYEKIHRMEEGYASRHTQILVDKNAYFKYSPLPTIPFAGSDFRNVTEIDLEDETSRFIFSEILVCGRVAHGERFAYRSYQNLVRIRQSGHLVYQDQVRFLPDQMDLEGMGMYEGYTHLGNLILCNVQMDSDWISRTRDLLNETAGIEGGVSVTAAGHIVVRMLGKSGQQLMRTVAATVNKL